MVDGETVEKLANLARISLSADEKVSLVSDLESILKYVSELSQVANSDLTETTDLHRNIFREDDISDEPGLYTDKILAEAPRQEDGYILVKQVMTEKGSRN